MRLPNAFRRPPVIGAVLATGLIGACLFRSGTSPKGVSLRPSSPSAGEPLPVLAFPRLLPLQRAGELPTDGGMKRDLFVFDGPRTAPLPEPKAAGPVPVPAAAPPDPERLQALAAAPRGLRYLGFLRGAPAGLLGAFMSGEEPLTIQAGSDRNGWRLVEVAEEAATFRNRRFPDLTLTLHAKGDS